MAKFLYLLPLFMMGVSLEPPKAKSQVTKRPNILFFLTDDQDVVLHGLHPMGYVQELLAGKGVTFSNAFTSSPMCCPSRASILTGMYAHNHATRNNSEDGGCYGEYWKSHIEPKALPVLLQKDGYYTFFAGKYLNQYLSSKVPPGWNNFHGLHGNSKYYTYNLTENGKITSYTDEYLTDILSDKLQTYLRTRKADGDKPFFAMIAPPAPHAPFTPAARHSDAFADTKALRTPNFNIKSGSLDKHWLISSGKILPESVLSTLDLYFRKRWESLLAVDELVANAVKTLEASGELDNTYIVYTSDNGYHIGQFAQPFDKRQPYETDIRVPFIVRGPKVPEKAVSNAPIILVDLFPTILEWAGIKSLENEDGISFNEFLLKPNYNPLSDKYFHRQILVQHWGEGSTSTYNPECPWSKHDKLAECSLVADCHCQDSWNNTYSCIRHFAHNTDKLYCEFKDDDELVEAYDVNLDIYQMTNLGYEWLPSERAMYSLALQNLTHCIGENCRNTRF